MALNVISPEMVSMVGKAFRRRDQNLKLLLTTNTRQSTLKLTKPKRKRKLKKPSPEPSGSPVIKLSIGTVRFPEKPTTIRPYDEKRRKKQKQRPIC